MTITRKPGGGLVWGATGVLAAYFTVRVRP
jgi:hypothetical protein